MQLPGLPFNTVWMDQLADDIASVNGCAALQALVNTAMATLQAELNAIEAQIAALLPVITIPTNLSEVIQWIENFIAPLAAAYQTYLAQVAALVAAVAKLTTAIEKAASSFTNCSINVPFAGPVKVTG